MPDKINKININGTSYDIQDNVSGYTSNTGTVTSINISNASNGGLTISGGPILTSGTINIGHSNILGAAQSSQAVYPIQIDKNGHISAYGSAVTIPEAPLIGTTSNITPTQVYNALVAGRDVSISYYFNDDHGEYSSPTITFNSFNIIDEPSTELYGISPVINMDVPGTFFLKLVGLISDDTWSSSVFQTLDGPDDVYEIVTLSNISQDLSTATADKDSAQIAYAAMAGKIPILYISGNNLSLIAQCTSIYTLSNQVYVEFSYLNQGSALQMPAYVHVVISGRNATITYNNGFLTAITSSDVISALGYTPYDSTNPSGYVTASGAASAAPVQSVNSQTGVVTLSASDVGALPSNTVIPTKTSDLTNDSGFITTETDPTVPSWAKASTKPSYTASEVGALPDTTVIPSKTSDLTNDSGFITGMTILSYGNSTWQDFLSAYNSNQVIYCRASSNSNPASGSQTRLAFMAYVSNATSPTNVEFQYYRSMSSHSDTQQGDEVYVYKLTSAGAWTVTVRKASPNIVAGTGLSRSYSNDTVTLSLDGTIPTKTSDLTNDSGYLTLSTLPIWDGSVT